MHQQCVRPQLPLSRKCFSTICTTKFKSVPFHHHTHASHHSCLRSVRHGFFDFGCQPSPQACSMCWIVCTVLSKWLFCLMVAFISMMVQASQKMEHCFIRKHFFGHLPS